MAFDNDDDAVGPAPSGLFHQKPACVSLMLNFYGIILWPLEQEFMISSLLIH